MRETRHARGGMLSRHVSKGNPSALVNVCICVRFTRPSLGVQTPARGSFVLSSLGWFVEVFMLLGGGRVFRRRAASVETCECRARLTDRRDGAGRFARRPAAAQYERPVKSPAGFCCALPHWWRRHATVHAVMNLLLLHVCACVRVCYGSFPRGRSRHAFGCCTASELIGLIVRVARRL